MSDIINEKILRNLLHFCSIASTMIFDEAVNKTIKEGHNV
jgi:hypothetical protein